MTCILRVRILCWCLSIESRLVGSTPVLQRLPFVLLPRHRNSSGETALHLAAMQLSLRGLSLLLAGGANTNVTDDQGRTPLHHACAASCHDGNTTDGDDRTRACIALLLSSGALEDARDANGQTPLHIAAARNNTCAAQALVAAGATETADAEGNLPLHLAAAQGHVETMELLVQGNRAESSAAVTSSSSVAALEDTREERASSTPSASGWKTYETADGHTYYQNDVTGESSWGPPVTSDGGYRASGNASANAADKSEHDASISAVAHQNGEPASRSCTDATYKDHVGLSGSRRDLSACCKKRETPTPNGRGMTYQGTSASGWAGTGRWDGEPPVNSISRHRDYQLCEEAGHEGNNMASGGGERKVWHKNIEHATQGTFDREIGGEDDVGTMPSTDDDSRHDQQGQEHTRRRPIGKEERRPRRSRRRGESDRLCRMIAWPQALSPEDYEQVITLSRNARVWRSRRTGSMCA